MDSGGGNTGSSDPAKMSSAETATNSLPGCGCASSNNITVRVTPTTGGQFDLQVAKTESVENFKKLISKKLKVPKERICLLHRDRQLRDGTLQENQLMDGSRLTLLPSVETGLLAQRPEQSVMQALESLNDTQVNDFLSGKAPLNLTMRLGDHMMLIQLQLSTVTPSSSRRSNSSSSSSSSSSSGTASSSSSSLPHSGNTGISSPSLSKNGPSSTSSSPSTSPAPTPSLSSVIAAAAANLPPAQLISLNSSSSSGSINSGSESSINKVTSCSNGPSKSAPAATNSRMPTATPSGSKPAPPPSAHPKSSSFKPGAFASTADAATSATATSTGSDSPSAQPHQLPKLMETVSNLLAKAPETSSTSSFHHHHHQPHAPSQPHAQTQPPQQQHTCSYSSSSASSSGASLGIAGGGGGGGGGGGTTCKCELPPTKPTLDTRALAEASRNLTQTLKQLSSEVLTSRSDTTEDSPRGGRRQGAIIESMHHHGKGVYSGTFSGTLNPALQDRYGRPKRDISTIIHILNDLLCATPQYRRHTRQGHSMSVETSNSTAQKKGTNTSDKSANTLEFMDESGSLSRENQATRGKMEHLRLIMEERRARRRARREARAAPYTTQWSAKSESLPQASPMGHDTVEPMETGEQSTAASASEQQLCELNPPEPVVA